MTTAPALDREEYIEQAYFFRAMRERLAEGLATQEALDHIHEEILSTTRLPMAIQFLSTEMKHSGQLSTGFARLAHYFTPFQRFIIEGTEIDYHRFDMEMALLVLEREADYRSKTPTPAGLFVYQFEVLCRNRLGYDEGLRAMAEDNFYDENWKEYLRWVGRQVGVVEIASLFYIRSAYYVKMIQRERPNYKPSLVPLFAEKEGKIAKANQGRDPLYLFAALQRQLDYPEVPRPKPREDLKSTIEALKARIHDLELRLKLVESEVKGEVDLSKFGTPEIFKDLDEEDQN